MNRSLLLLLVFGTMSTFALLSLYLLGGPPSPEALWPAAEYDQGPTSKARVAVFESTGWHDEVVAALVYAIGQQPSTELTLYLRGQRYGVDQLYTAFAPRASIFPAAHLREHLVLGGSSTPAPDVVVLATGEADFATKNTDVFHHLFTSSSHTRLLCVVHHADKWEAGLIAKRLPFILPWVEAGRITFLTLSPHVAERLSTVAIPTWPRQESTTTPLARVETFVPVFPVDPAWLAGQRTSVEPGQTPFVIQGNFDPARRDYDRVLSRLGSDPQAANLTLHLLGSGRGSKQLQEKGRNISRVVIDVALDYLPYYATIARSVALVPSFATDEYYSERASSTVPASLIAGCPLVANRRLLATYTYLNESVVWVQEEGEDEMDVVVRVGHDRNAGERSAKSENVRRRTMELCAAGVRQFARWIAEATAAACPDDTPYQAKPSVGFSPLAKE